MARRTWYRLDNIGKFYSSQAGRSSQTVFRYSAELADGIDPDILQHALDHAIAQFPSFNVHLLNGMFWHYLEQSDGRPLVEPEHLPICSRLHYGPKSMLFRVSYFRNRVNLEVSHIISDGRGAINLFKSLLHAYIAERYDVPGVPSDYDGSDSDKAENSFDKYYEKDKAGAAPGTKIYRLAGPIDRAAPTFMEYHVSASKVLGAAHQCGVSLTSYLIAAILCAIRDVMPSRARNRAIRVDIPVDLRAFFRSETVRNFYGMTYVAYTPAEIEADEDSAKTSATSPDAAGDGQQSAARTAHGNGMGGLLTDEPLADIARHVQEQLGHATSRERVESHMNRMIALEKNPVLRLAPSPAKDWVLELARFIADRETTTTVSNLGRVTLDERLARHVRSVTCGERSVGMKHCDACTVDFTGDMARCPLCQNELRGEASPAAFPAQQIYLRPRRLAVEIITFVTGAILLLHGFFSYLFSWPIPIASASAAALIISVLFINSAILHVPRPLRLMFRYFYIMLAIALVWFVATMNHVVTMFVIPITCLVSLVFDVVLLIVLRAKAIDEYAKYLAFDIVAGLMPLTFIPLGWAPWDVLVMVSGLVSLLVLLGLLVFARRQLFSEFGKQFSA